MIPGGSHAAKHDGKVGGQSAKVGKAYGGLEREASGPDMRWDGS